MKIGLLSSAVPLVSGGYRNIVDWLEQKLLDRGHEVETIYLPYIEELSQILPQIVAFRMIKLTDYFERIITFRPPSHLVKHPCKVVWFIHHLRAFYDLWQTPYCGIPDTIRGRAIRSAIFAADKVGLAEAHRLFTNSRAVGERIRTFNNLMSEVLYPPIGNPAIFSAGEYGDEIVSICRIENHKRQHLLVKAMAHTRTPVRLRLCGSSLNASYVQSLREEVKELAISDRVTIDNRWITEKEKADLLTNALASAYVPYDEDSYGYPSIEAAHSRRCTITVLDAGGVLEFVTEGNTGTITEPTPAAIAGAMDRLFADRSLARRLGDAAHARITELGIDWDYVIDRLLE